MRWLPPAIVTPIYEMLPMLSMSGACIRATDEERLFTQMYVLPNMRARLACVLKFQMALP